MIISKSSALGQSTYQCYILSLQQQFSERSRCFSLCLDLKSLVQNYVHVLIEAQNFSFQSDIRIIVKPNLYSTFALQKSKDHSERVNTFGLSFFRHL